MTELISGVYMSHSTHDALEGAAQMMLDFQSGWVPDGFTECADAIRKIKEQVK